MMVVGVLGVVGFGAVAVLVPGCVCAGDLQQRPGVLQLLPGGVRRRDWVRAVWR
jgi:hypothetical protein